MAVENLKNTIWLTYIGYPEYVQFLFQATAYWHSPSRKSRRLLRSVPKQVLSSGVFVISMKICYGCVIDVIFCMWFKPVFVKSDISCWFHTQLPFTHRIGGNLKLLRESTNADRKWLKIAFFWLHIVVLDCQFAIYNAVLMLIDPCYSTLAEEVLVVSGLWDPNAHSMALLSFIKEYC